MYFINFQSIQLPKIDIEINFFYFKLPSSSFLNTLLYRKKRYRKKLDTEKVINFKDIGRIIQLLLDDSFCHYLTQNPNSNSHPSSIKHQQILEILKKTV